MQASLDLKFEILGEGTKMEAKYSDREEDSNVEDEVIE